MVLCAFPLGGNFGLACLVEDLYLMLTGYSCWALLVKTLLREAASIHCTRSGIILVHASLSGCACFAHVCSRSHRRCVEFNLKGQASVDCMCVMAMATAMMTQ